MIDIITYIPNLESFRAEAKSMAESGNEFFVYDPKALEVIYKVNRIPVHYNADGIRSVCLVRLMSQDEIDTFNSLTTCQRIGVCENKSYIFDDDGEDIYNNVYDQSPISTPEGTYTPPAMIGFFA